MAERKNDNLSKFMEDWNFCFRHCRCRFTKKYLEDLLLLKQIRVSTIMTPTLTYYNYKKILEGEVLSYTKPCGFVGTRLEEERCQEAKADLLGSTKITRLVSTATGKAPGSKSIVCR